MSEQRQNNPGGSTLFGTPLPEIVDSTRIDESNVPMVEGTVSPKSGLVIDIVEDGNGEKKHRSGTPRRNTDVQMLFNVFGEEKMDNKDSAKEGHSLDALSQIIQEYEANQSKRVVSGPPRVPPPIPKAALKKSVASTQPLSPYVSSAEEEDAVPESRRISVASSLAAAVARSSATARSMAVAKSTASIRSTATGGKGGLSAVHSSEPTPRQLKPTLDFSDDTRIEQPNYHSRLRASLRASEVAVQPEQDYSFDSESESTIPPSVFRPTASSDIPRDSIAELSHEFGECSEDMISGHRLGSEVVQHEEFSDDRSRELGAEVTGQGLALRISEDSEENSQESDDPVVSISSVDIPSEVSGYGSDVATSQSESIDEGGASYTYDHCHTHDSASNSGAIMVDELVGKELDKGDDENEATVIVNKRRQFTLGSGSGGQAAAMVPPQYDEDVFSEPIEESQPLVGERFGRVDISNPMQRIGTGTVAFMPHDNLPLDDEELDEEDLDRGGESKPPTLSEGSLELNSECMEEELSVEQPSDIPIPIDASGFPMAKIIRTRDSHRAKSPSRKGYHHLSSVGLYDRPSVEFMREEISSEKSYVSPKVQEPQHIDVHLSAAIEIAYGTDREAAMRTPTLISSIILKNPQQIEVLTSHFPGRLFVDPFEMAHDEIEPVSEHGPIVASIAKLQMLGVNFLTRFLRHPEKYHRFYAMMLINEMVPQSATKVLLDRLADEDPDIRVHASSALLKRRSQPNFDSQVLEHLRKIIANPEEESDLRVKYAARFLAIVLDSKAVPYAISLLEKEPSEVKCNAALEFLRALTLQRFRNPGEWRRWAIGKNFDERMSRFFWLIDALNDPSLLVRQEAYDQLNPTFGSLLSEYLPSHPEPLRRRIQNTLRVQFQKK